MNRVKNFISDHKVFFIGFIAYIAVFIISSFIAPWQIRDIKWTDIDESVMPSASKIPINIKIMFYGIYELLELLLFADSETFAGNGIVFFISACAVFTYVHFISNLFIKEENIENKIEKIAVSYIYDNIFSYIICLIMYYFFNPAYGGIMKIFSSHGNASKVLIIFLFIMIIILPSLPQIFKVIGYTFAMTGMVRIIDIMSDKLVGHKLLFIVLSFLVTVIMIVLLNLLIELVMKALYSAGFEGWVAVWEKIFSSAVAIAIIVGGFLIASIVIILIVNLAMK